MRLVYVFDLRSPDVAPGPYLVRMPRLVARALCRLNRHLDYALNWW